MTPTSSTSAGRRIYAGVVFDPTEGNYTEWKDSVFSAIRWESLSRWAIPLKEGEEAVKKEKPKVDAEKIEAWEDSAEKAMVLIHESLGTHRWVVKDAETPGAAFKAMHDLYSGATENDATRLETRWVTETPKGDNLMEYIATMTMLKDKFALINIDRSEKDLCLRMMTPLSQYPDEHPYREAWKWLNKQFIDDSSKVTVAYFKRYVQAASEELANHGTIAKGKNDSVIDDAHALLVIERLTQKLEHALSMVNSSTANKKNWPGSAEYTGCRFCGSKRHQIKDCDDPGFDSERWKRNKGSGKVAGNGVMPDPRRKTETRGGRGRGEKAHLVNDGPEGRDGSDADVSALVSSGMKMNKALELYEQIGKHPSPGMDPGAVGKGGNSSPAPPYVTGCGTPSLRARNLLISVAMPCVSFQNPSLSDSST